MAWNKEDEATSAGQRGGCLQIVRDKAATSWNATGQDPTGLGRWTWTRHRGKHNITVKIYTAYRTCVSNNNLGESTIHRQQLRYLHHQHDDRHPRQALLEDLSADIAAAQLLGDQIILMMDMNEHVRDQHILEFALQLNLREAITERHASTLGFAPLTRKAPFPSTVYSFPQAFISQQVDIYPSGTSPVTTEQFGPSSLIPRQSGIICINLSVCQPGDLKMIILVANDSSKPNISSF